MFARFRLCPGLSSRGLLFALLSCSTPAQSGGLDPVQLVSIRVAPDSVALDPGASQLFAAQATWSDGSHGPTSVTWSASGGGVLAGGSYTAGAAPGAYVVRAEAQAGLEDSAIVVVLDTSSNPPPPPPPPPTTLVQEDFEDANLAARGWYDNTSVSVTAAEHIPGSTKSLELTFNQGATVPASGAATRIRFSATDRVYLSYWVKYSANWIGSGVNYHPHEFQFVTNEDGQWIGPSATHLTTYVEHVYLNGGIPILSMQDALNIDAAHINQDLSAVTENRAAGGCNGETDGYKTSCYQLAGEWRNGKQWRAAQPAFLPTPGPGYKADWHHVEAFFQLNTLQSSKGRTDGIAQYWFDGQLEIDNHDVLFRTGAHPAMKFNQFLIAPYIGVGSPVTQTMWLDNLTIGTARP
jgi:hypothetical protein